MNVRYYTHRGQVHLDFRVNGKRYRPSSGCTTEAAARKVAAEVIAKALAAEPKAPSTATVPMGGPTLREAYKLAMKQRESWLTSKNKGTIETTFDSLGLPDETPMASLTRDRVRELRTQWLAEPGKRKGTTLAPSTVNHRLSMLSVLLEVCDLPPHMVKHLSTKGNGRKRRISDEEVAQAGDWCLRNAGRAGVHAFSVAVRLALETAAREGELLGLEWRDVAADTVTFRDTKNHESRTVPLTPAAQRLLEARRGLPAPFSDLNKDRVVKLWDEMRRDMGLEHDEAFVFHTLRHEAISRLIETPGVSPMTVQAMAGHASITTTQLYAHASLEAMRRAQQGATP